MNSIEHILLYSVYMNTNGLDTSFYNVTVLSNTILKVVGLTTDNIICIITKMN